ncbi:MAG: hypothetical protein PHU25_16830 [Deltaproteobacteria bacterium]|nr:hypothetical protein [Deltaproteobacteria bacterium]
MRTCSLVTGPRLHYDRRMLHKSFVPLLLAACAGCGDPPVREPASWSAILIAECAKISACTGEAVDSCFSVLSRREAYDPFEGALAMRERELRADCVAGAGDCGAVAKCIDEAQAAIAAEMQEHGAKFSCGNEESTLCEDGLLAWCFMGEYDTEAAAITVDIGELGKVCNSQGSWAADPDRPACGTADYSRACDGDGVRECMDRESVTWSCAVMDPELTCTIDEDNPGQVRCSMPEGSRQCESNNYNNYGESARCHGTIARVCAAGKLFDVDCAAFPGAKCVDDGDYSAHCEL